MKKESTLKILNEKCNEFIKKKNLCLTKTENNIIFDAMLEGAMLGIVLTKTCLNKMEEK